MTTEALPAASMLAIQVELARRSYRHFLPWVITENDEGYPVPAPIDLPTPTDPLQSMIDSGECLPRPPAWPHIMEMAGDWESGKSLVYLKARQMWFTHNAAAYALWVAQQRGNVYVLSQGQDYANAVIERCHYIYDRLPAELKLKLTTDNTRELKFKGAGRIMSLPSTRDAGRGFTGRLVIVDEAAFHPYGSENYRAYRPSVAASSETQLLMISTANGPHGFYHSQFMAAFNGHSDYDWRFYPWTSRPDHDREWYENEKRNYEGFVEDFVRENPTTIDEAFSTLAGLVYKEFNPDIHVGAPKVRFEDCKIRIAGVDWGGGDPSAVVILGLSPDDHVYQYDEFAQSGPITLDEIGGFIRRWRDKAPLISVECDPSQGVAIRTLARQFGVPARPANNARKEGLDLTRFLLENNRLTVDASCQKSIDEFFGYRWRETRDPNTKERYATTTPVDHHGDLMDARRYALMRLMQFMRSGPTLQTTSGKPFARKAV